MHKLADSLQDHADQFARLIVMEQGKPLSEAQHEAPMGIRLLRYMADNVDYAPVVLKSDGDKKLLSTAGRSVWWRRLPPGTFRSGCFS